MYVFPHLAGTDPVPVPGYITVFPAVPARAVRDARRAPGGLLMAWSCPGRARHLTPASLASRPGRCNDDAGAAWHRSPMHGIPGTWQRRIDAAVPSGHRADHAGALRRVAVVRRPAAWVEYLPAPRACCWKTASRSPAFFELAPVGTEGREMAWLWQARDALENALQDSFDELDENPWVVSSTPRTNRPGTTTGGLATTCGRAPQGSASASSTCASSHHLRAIAKPGGLFEDTTVTRLPWRGQVRRVRMVVIGARPTPQRPPRPIARAGAGDDLRPARRRLANARRQTRRLTAADIHDWLLRWFNPHPRCWGRPRTGNASTR